MPALSNNKKLGIKAAMKLSVLILFFVACRIFAGDDTNSPAAGDTSLLNQWLTAFPDETNLTTTGLKKWLAHWPEDTNLLAAGDWSQPVATDDGAAIRGRLVLGASPHLERPVDNLGTNVYLALELQEFSSNAKSVKVCWDVNFGDGSRNLRCELRDTAGMLVRQSSKGMSGSFTGPHWVSLGPRECVRNIISASFARWDEVTLDIILNNGQIWEVPLGKSNEHYLAGTFTAVVPTNQANIGPVLSSAFFAWGGTLTLPPVKIPGDFGALNLPLVNRSANYTPLTASGLFKAEHKLVEVTFTADVEGDYKEVDSYTILKGSIQKGQHFYGKYPHPIQASPFSHGTPGSFHVVRPDTNALEKAEESLKLLRPLAQPTGLPESTNRIVTVRYLDSEELVEKKFPVDQVPDEVHHVFAIMGFTDINFRRLTFIQSPGQPLFTNPYEPIKAGQGF